MKEYRRFKISGGVVRLARLNKGIKQEVVAEFLGMSQSTYSRLEDGYKPFTLDLCQPLCQLLDIDIMVLVNCQDQTQTRLLEGERRGSFICRNGRILLHLMLVKIASWFFLEDQMEAWLDRRSEG